MVGVFGDGGLAKVVASGRCWSRDDLESLCGGVDGLVEYIVGLTEDHDWVDVYVGDGLVLVWRVVGQSKRYYLKFQSSRDGTLYVPEPGAADAESYGRLCELFDGWQVSEPLVVGPAQVRSHLGELIGRGWSSVVNGWVNVVKLPPIKGLCF